MDMRIRQWTGLGLLSLGYAASLMHGRLGAESIITFALLLCCAYAVNQRHHKAAIHVGHAVFTVLAISLAFHWLPGFSGARVIDAVRFTPDAAPFTMYLNLDKPLIGFWLLLACPWVVRWQSMHRTVLGSAGALSATALVTFGAALALGVIAWAPKWPEQAWLWVFNNLLLVSLTEEALFRGYIQGGLGKLLKSRSYGDCLALAAASLLFGLVHVGGGWQWMLLATLAGVGYGAAYRYGGLAAAVLTHFGFNLLHFGVFTYPMLSP
jgi:membrane protease YdiL (CAAX protease family)